MSETTERTEEYRVVGGDPPELVRGVPRPILHLPAAESWANQLGAQIQTRTVTSTPWVDLDEGEGR